MSIRSRRDNLRVELSDFVGRRREASEVRRLLASNRLVTLTGTGGVGKTRLALHVAQQARRTSPDGVWLVELATLADPELAVTAVAGALGVADRSQSPALASYLEDKRLLLVLDNCEHLIDACATLVDELLTRAPRLRVLATSRQPLSVEGERVFRLPPLSTPDPGALPAGDLSEFEAVRLFVARARAVSPTFAVTTDNRAAVAAVCRQLDGIALAIELAAARLRVLSVEQILSRLNDRFRLLTTGSAAAPARQQTLRAALDWGHGLCSPHEQVLWARSSVFSGGFDLEAAEAVCSGDDIEPGEVFKLLAGLVDKSILFRESSVDHAVRYALPDTTRQYGQECLVAAGQDAILGRRHRAYYGELARQASADWISPREVEWLLRLRRELPNLRLAMESGLVDAGAAHTALEIAVATRELWFGAGQFREGQRWLTRGLAQCPEPTPLRAIALADLGYLTLLLGDAPASRPMPIEAHFLSDRPGKSPPHAAISHDLAHVALTDQPPDLTRGLALTELALAEARAGGDLRRISHALLQTALIAAFTGNPRAAGYAEDCLALAEAYRAEWTKSWALTILALARRQHDARVQVAALLHKALQIQRFFQDSWGTAICLELLAWTASSAGRHAHAALLLGACEAINQRQGASLAELGPFAEHHAECVRDAQHALGMAVFSAAFDGGGRLSLDEAIRHSVGAMGTTPTAIPSRPAQIPNGPLTRREQQIAVLVAEGLPNRDIAARLLISKRTAESHVGHILNKLGFGNRTQIAAWIAQRGRQ